MAQEQIQELKEKLEAQQAEFQNYKTECKQLEEFLEEESSKKEDEIRKIKEEAIKKQKTYSLLKVQVGQLESENKNLKDQLEQNKAGSNEEADQKLQQAIRKLEEANKKCEVLTAECGSLKSQMEAERGSFEKSTKEISATNMKTQAELTQKIGELQRQLEAAKNEKNKSSAKTEEKKQQRQKKSLQQVSGQKESDAKKHLAMIDKLEKQLEETRSECQKSNQANFKLSKQIKELKAKSQALSGERENLMRKVKELSTAASRSHKKEEEEGQRGEVAENYDEEERDESKQNNSISALIMTKKHYVSPFLEIKNNLVKVYKSTKNGCFEKSLGSNKYKLTGIGYDPEEILASCAKNIITNMSRGIRCSVILFGPKKSTKKYLMANLVQKLKEFLEQRMRECEEDISAEFVKASQNAEERIEMKGKNRQQTEQILQKVLSLAAKSPKKQDAKKKGQSKPKARIFKISFGEELSLEIITSSFTNVVIRDNMTLTETLNNICYARLPNSLQETDCFREIILTVNPIVSLYEDCKNTLAISNCKKHPQNEHYVNEWQESPVKDDLNNHAKKKMESIERQSEQYSLKVRRLEDDIGFYKTKFDQLEVRLKNLMNTHNAQNTYLKKSPVTLSYEKMLKFVHNVQARNFQSMGTSRLNEETRLNEESMNIEDGYGSEQVL